jgi:hypothetical protein
MSARDPGYVAIETIRVSREIAFACGWCRHIETVKLLSMPEAHEQKIDNLPEGWTLLRTNQGMRGWTEQIVCGRHELTIGKAREPKP